MSGCIKDVDSKSVVIKVHDGARDGNAAFLFHFHKVTGGGTLFGLLSDGTRLLNGSTVQQEFFRHGRLARIGMRYNGQVSAPINLGLWSLGTRRRRR